MSKLHLIAVQQRLDPQDFTSEDAFVSKIDALMQAATAGISEGDKLIAFPEALALPLLFADANVLTQKTAGGAFRTWFVQNWRALVKELWRGPSSVLFPHALAAERIYRQTFAEAARRYNATIVAGSGFLPTIDHEPSRGWHLTEPLLRRCIYNFTYTFAPSGTRLGITGKQQVTTLEQRLGIKPSKHPPQVMTTPCGKLGVTICLDGFYDGIISHLDGLGAQVIVQPSANYALWDGPWTANARTNQNLREGEAWLRYGLAHTIQHRTHIRYGLNPMLVGGLWGMRAEGRSSIVANIHHPHNKHLDDPLLAIAPTPYDETFVRATVTLE
ncbi:MAG: nitrilase-related carbon-nitrogen hydrolase [Deinococcota bacterium]